MKKIIYLLLFIGVSAAVFAAGSGEPYKRPGQPTIPYAEYLFAPTLGKFVRNWVQPYAIYAFNSSGATLKKDWVVIWDTSKTFMIDSTPKVTACDTMTLIDTTTTKRWKMFRLWWLNSVSACTLKIVGLDTNLTAQRDSFVFNSSAAYKWSTKIWRKITYVIWRHGASNDSIAGWIAPYMGVRSIASQGHLNVAGIVAAAALADSLVKLNVGGVMPCSLLATIELFPGDPLVTSASAGYGEADLTPSAGAQFGRVLMPGNATELYWIYLSP